MTTMTTHRQIVYRVLPQTRPVWQWPNNMLEDQRQLYHAACKNALSVIRKPARAYPILISANPARFVVRIVTVLLIRPCRSSAIH